MNPTLSGIHHVTAIAGEPQANVDFYTGVLGLRMVKLTVNFDDPYIYHLYYGDERGRPGSVMTFFPWPGAGRGARGTGQATAVSFSVHAQALEFWREHLGNQRVAYDGPLDRFGESLLALRDPDDLALEIVASPTESRESSWKGGPVPPRYAIRGFHSVTLREAGVAETESMLQETLGFRRTAQAGDRVRYELGSGGPGACLDVTHDPHGSRGVVSVGTVHHVAWRTPDNDNETAWQAEIRRHGHQVTPVTDRHYFRSIYFREPGGVLFEIATESPGFTIDEPVERLGLTLMLPPWLEPRREQLIRQLPAVKVPAA